MREAVHSDQFNDIRGLAKEAFTHSLSGPNPQYAVPIACDFFSSFFISLIAHGPKVAILPVVTRNLPIFPRFTPYGFLSRCKFSILTTRQLMVKFYLLAY